jgi:hypothetical protein
MLNSLKPWKEDTTNVKHMAGSFSLAIFGSRQLADIESSDETDYRQFIVVETEPSE